MPGMESKVIALLADDGNREATLMVRRSDGQFALSRIDARIASATRLAARYAPALAEPSSEIYTGKR